MQRVSEIELLITGTKTKRSFGISHAERILAMPKSGWELPKDSKFTYNQENGLKLRTNKRKT